MATLGQIASARWLSLQPTLKGVRFIAHVACADCGAEDDWTASRMPSPEVAIKKVRARGWTIEAKRATCPTCSGVGRAEKTKVKPKRVTQPARPAPTGPANPAPAGRIIPKATSTSWEYGRLRQEVKEMLLLLDGSPEAPITRSKLQEMLGASATGVRLAIERLVKSGDIEQALVNRVIATERNNATPDKDKTMTTITATTGEITPLAIPADNLAANTITNKAPPTPEARAARRKVIELLEDHFSNGAYSIGWSDKRIAGEAGLGEPAVAAIREDFFGPIRVSPELLALRIEVDTVMNRAESASRIAQGAQADANRAIEYALKLQAKLESIIGRQ